MIRRTFPTPGRVPRGSDEETAILLLLIKRSQAGELGRDNFGRHLSVQREGARWRIGDTGRNGGAEYMLTDRQAAAVASGQYRIEHVPTPSELSTIAIRWPAMGDPVKPCPARPTGKLEVVKARKRA